MRKTIIAAALAATTLGALVGPSLASASSSCIYSVRGCVHVQGYTKPSTGTYVAPYVRNYPSYRPYTYHAPSYRPYTYRPSRSYGY